MIFDLLNEASNHLSKEQITSLLQKTRIALTEEYRLLVSQLDNEQWDEAAKQAHRLKGTASLAGCGALVSSLQLVVSRQIDTISTPEFSNRLFDQYNACQARVTELHPKEDTTSRIYPS